MLEFSLIIACLRLRFVSFPLLLPLLHHFVSQSKLVVLFFQSILFLTLSENPSYLLKKQFSSFLYKSEAASSTLNFFISFYFIRSRLLNSKCLQKFYRYEYFHLKENITDFLGVWYFYRHRLDMICYIFLSINRS